MVFMRCLKYSFESLSVMFSAGDTIIKGTAGFNTPFNLIQGDNVQITSLSYSMPQFTMADCPYMKFNFYAQSTTLRLPHTSPLDNFVLCASNLEA